MRKWRSWWSDSFGRDRTQLRGFAANLIVTTGVTTVVWLVVTMLTKPEPEATLAAFYERVHPAGPGWSRFGTRGSGELWRNAAMWVAGMVLVYSTMFATAMTHSTRARAARPR